MDFGRDGEFDYQPENYTDPLSNGEVATCITYKFTIIDKRTKLPICKKVIKYRGAQSTAKDKQRVLKEFEVLFL